MTFGARSVLFTHTTGPEVTLPRLLIRKLRNAQKQSKANGVRHLASWIEPGRYSSTDFLAMTDDFRRGRLRTSVKSHTRFLRKSTAYDFHYPPF